MAGTIEIIIGNTYSSTITITDSNGAVDITGNTVKFKIARTLSVSDAGAEYLASTEDATDLVMTTPASGICTLTIPEDTTKAFAPGTYKWQIRYIDGSNVSDTDAGVCEIKDSLFDAET